MTEDFTPPPAALSAQTAALARSMQETNDHLCRLLARKNAHEARRPEVEPTTRAPQNAINRELNLG